MRVSHFKTIGNEPIADGSPIIVWAISNPTQSATTFSIVELDSEQVVTSNVIMTITQSTDSGMFNFPYGLQCHTGIALIDLANESIVVYSKIQ